MTVSEYVNKTMASVPGFGIQATGQEYDPGKGDWIITLSDGRRMYSNSPEFKELKSTGLVHMDTKYKTTQVQSGKLNPELQRFIDLEKENSFSEFLRRRDRLGQNYSQDPSNAPQSYKDDYDAEMNRKWAADFIERNPRNQDENRGQYLDRITKGLDQSIVDNLYRNLPEKEGTTYWEDSKRGINYLADALPGQNVEDYILNDTSLSQREKQERLQDLKNNPNLSRVMGGLETLSALSVPVEFVTAAGREDYSIEDAAGGVKNDTPLSTKFMLDPLNLMGFGIEGAALKGVRGARYLKGVDEAAGVVRYGDEVWDTSRVLNEAKVADKQFDLYSGLSRARESKSKYIRENIKNWLQEYKEGKISLEEYQKLTEVPNSFVNFKSLTSAAKNKGNALRTNQEEIVKNFNDFNNKTYTGGSNNLGVTPIGDNYIVRHSDKGYGDHANDMLIMSQGIDNPRVMRTVQVGEDNLGRTHQVQQRASGVTLDKLTQEQIDQIPLDHYKQLEADLNYLRERNIGIDPSKGDNFFYDKDKGFQFIDLSRSENPSNSMDNIFSTLKSDDGLIFNPNKSPNVAQKPSENGLVNFSKISSPTDEARTVNNIRLYGNTLNEQLDHLKEIAKFELESSNKVKSGYERIIKDLNRNPEAATKKINAYLNNSDEVPYTKEEIINILSERADTNLNQQAYDKLSNTIKNVESLYGLDKKSKLPNWLTFPKKKKIEITKDNDFESYIDNYYTDERPETAYRADGGVRLGRVNDDEAVDHEIGHDIGFLFGREKNGMSKFDDFVEKADSNNIIQNVYDDFPITGADTSHVGIKKGKDEAIESFRNYLTQDYNIWNRKVPDNPEAGRYIFGNDKRVVEPSAYLGQVKGFAQRNKIINSRTAVFDEKTLNSVYDKTYKNNSHTYYTLRALESVLGREKLLQSFNQFYTPAAIVGTGAAVAGASSYRNGGEVSLEDYVNSTLSKYIQ